MAQQELPTELEMQKKYIDRKNKQDFTLIAASAFVEGMRDSGYKSTATAIDEFIDNSLQAGATRVDVIAARTQGIDLAVIDDGHGMLPDMMRASVVWGGTHRHDDREGLGRYGFGLPSAAVSITRHYDVYSRVHGKEWYKISIKLDDIVSGKLTDEHGTVRAPYPVKTHLPDFVKDSLVDRSLENGTVIVLNAVDRLTPGYVRPDTFNSNLREHLGLVYRGFLPSRQIFVNGKKVDIVDPLFLNPDGCFHEVKANDLKAEEQEPLEIQFGTVGRKKSGTIRLRFSYLPYRFQGVERNRKNDPELMGRFKIMRDNNAFFIVTRAGRQIDLVSKTPFGNSSALVNNDRNWAIELDFSPELDEEFGITVNKQQVTLSEQVWDTLKEAGVPGMIRSLRGRFNTDRTKEEAKKPEEFESKPSEEAMAESEKYENRGKPLPEKTRLAAIDRVKQAAKKVAEHSSKDFEEVHTELMKRTESNRYKVLYESLPGAPFYRAEYYGSQLQLFINMAHRFYTDLYGRPDLTPRTKEALDLLLFALAYCENQASETLAEFYKRERQEWSNRLETYLGELNRIDPVDPAGDN